MLLKDEVEMLRQVPYFSRLKPANQAASLYIRAYKLSAGRCDLSRGRPSEAAFVVLRGEVKFEGHVSQWAVWTGFVDAGPSSGKCAFSPTSPLRHGYCQNAGGGTAHWARLPDEAGFR